MHHRTPCIWSANDRADKRCTPCTSSGASPRARTGRSASGLSAASCPSSSATPPPVPQPLWEGPSSASCPSSSTLLSASRRHWHRRYPELESSPSDATPSSSSFLRAPTKCRRSENLQRLSENWHRFPPQSPALSQATGVAGFTRDSSSTTGAAVQDRRSSPVDPPRAVLVSQSTFPKRPLVGSEVRT
jgi:hypothetical protein